MINELKKQYQNNLILGTVISALLVLVGVMVLVPGQEENVIISLENSVIFEEWPATRSQKTYLKPDDKSRPAISVVTATDINYISGQRLRDYSTKNKGMADFMTIEPDFFEPYLTSDFNFGVRSIIYLPEYDPSYDYYLNEPIDMLKKKPWPIRIPDNFYNSQICMNRKNIDQPVVIRNLFVERPKNTLGIIGMEEIEDTVFIRVTIDYRGHILNMETVYENPPGLGFADKFKDALANASISPFKINGGHEGGSFLVYCIFSRHGRNTVSNSEVVTIK